MNAGKRTVTSIKISGFRAYLHQAEFNLKTKSSLAIFAPNAHGKSSFVDAFEFIFSEEGTLRRLGLKKINNFAGPEALAHNSASSAGIESFVEIAFSPGSPPKSERRSASSAKSSVPPLVDDVRRKFVVDPIIRGYELRSFVENETTETRYETFVRWLQLEPLTVVQSNLKLLRKQCKAASKDETGFKSIDRKLATLTGGAITTWNDPKVIAYWKSLVFENAGTAAETTPRRDDAAYVNLCTRALNESNRLGVDALRQLRTSIAGLYDVSTEPDDSSVTETGLLVEWSDALTKIGTASEVESAERAAAASAVFARLWDEAEPIFRLDESAPADCPICRTPIGSTAAGSVSAIREHIGKCKDELKSYAAAKKALLTAQEQAANKKRELVSALKLSQNLLPTDQIELSAYLADHVALLERWSGADAPPSVELRKSLSLFAQKLDADIDAILVSAGPLSASKLKAKADTLLELNAERILTMRNRLALESIHTALSEQSVHIASQIRAKVQALLDLLRDGVSSFYAQIQGERANKVRIELPPADDINQQRLNLLIDFATNREGVQPSGYLSDSQIHSLALAIRLAAIRQFNIVVPLIVLDDVVTSYDADHRRAIAALIARELKDCQVIVVTHDERFYLYLKDQLSESSWQFKRINRFDPEFGPRFSDHVVSDDMITARWADGKSAANEMRQAEEEWLLSMCRGFGASVTIRAPERAYSYERSELAGALAQVLKGLKLLPPAIPGVTNPFLSSLIKGEVENFGSHFQEAPYGDGSIGDERVRWVEFTTFRDAFKCPVCNKSKFKKVAGLTKPVCAVPTCETQFRFQVIPVVAI